MPKFKYGPLVWNSINDEDESGNYFWNGKPPVDYDSDGIPIDDDGMQCLPIASPVHPSWTAESVQQEYNDFLGFEIPSISSTREWFDDNFLVANERQCKKYIIRWIKQNRSSLPGFYKMISEATSLADIMDRVWPQDEHK
tara:strand:- start:182 stop:601 length:420 start_codon:yes stop_codon:yes gene_type:complete